MSIAYDIYRVLLDHCTKEGDGKDTFIRAFSSLLERSTFKQGLSAHDLWKRVWDKPFFSNVMANHAASEVERTRHVFEQLALIQSNGWEIVGPATGEDADYQITGRDLQAALDGKFPSLNGPLKHPCTGFRLYRNRQLALAMPKIAREHQVINAWLSANHAVGKAFFGARSVAEDRCLRNVFRQKMQPLVIAIDEVPGFALTTAYHVLADIGYPVYKPDTWVRAFVLALPDVGVPLAGILGCGLNNLPADLLNPENVYARELMFDRLDTLVDKFTEPLPELGGLGALSGGFLRLRAADFLFAHIGIGAEEGFGLYRTPLDALNDPHVATQYPALAVIAHNIRALGTASVKKATVSANLRAAINDLGRNQPAAPRCQSCDSRAMTRGVACPSGF